MTPPPPTLITALTQSHIFRFAVVGTMGFLTEALIISLGTTFLDIGVIAIRIPSFSVAVLLTWYLNRNYTFAMHHKSFRDSFPPYITANAIGLSLNFASYAVIALLFPVTRQWPVLLLAIGSAIGMVFNFCAAKFFIFTSHKKPPPPTESP